MVERLPSPPRWFSVKVDIPGGSTLTEQERMLYFRELPECFQFKFGNPTYRNCFEVIPRKTYPLMREDGDEDKEEDKDMDVDVDVGGQDPDQGEDQENDQDDTDDGRLINEIPTASWMWQKQVSAG